jgi:hypothetical protein
MKKMPTHQSICFDGVQSPTPVPGLSRPRELVDLDAESFSSNFDELVVRLIHLQC